MTTFTRHILSIPTYPQQKGQTDVVFEVNWQYMAIENGYYSESYGTTAVIQNPDSFTPYKDLTEAQIWSWVDAVVNPTEMEANLQKLIDEQKTPTKAVLPMPWLKQGEDATTAPA